MVLGLLQNLNSKNPFLKPLENCGCGIGSLVSKLTGNDDENDENVNVNANANENGNNNGFMQNANPFQNAAQTGKFGPKMMKFEHLTWEKLPNNARKSAVELGYTQETWNEGWSDLAEYWWEDLSASQKDAAARLGWDQGAWDSKYNDTSWDDLPPNANKAVTYLGFTKWAWDEGEWPAVGEKYWEGMTQEERNALYVLGYNGDNWS